MTAGMAVAGICEHQARGVTEELAPGWWQELALRTPVLRRGRDPPPSSKRCSYLSDKLIAATSLGTELLSAVAIDGLARPPFVLLG